MSVLPDAVQQNPACGACGNETRWHRGGDWCCEDCQLYFRAGDLSAAFLDPDSEPCGNPCDNSWHGDHNIKPGLGFDCSPCKLPAGHISLHWTGCQSKQLT